MRRWHPWERGFRIDPGMVKTSQFCSAANFAVIRKPELRIASTTSVQRLNSLMMRLRRGKCWGGDMARGSSEKRGPLGEICSARRCWRRGYILVKVLPSTAMLWPPAFKAPCRLAASMPSGKAAGDVKTSLDEFLRHFLCDFAAGDSRITATNDGKLRLI